jgi:hypothetical protein
MSIAGRLLRLALGAVTIEALPEGPRGAPRLGEGGAQSRGEVLGANTAAAESVVDYQDHDRADGGHQDAVEVDAGGT